LTERQATLGGYMIVFNSLEELKAYYYKDINTYVFEDDVKFNFDVYVYSNINGYNITALDIKAIEITALNINAGNINAMDINVSDINAGHIKAGNINASNINALNISALNITALNITYHAVCFSYDNIICNSIQGRRDNHRHFSLDGEIITRQ